MTEDFELSGNNDCINLICCHWYLEEVTVYVWSRVIVEVTLHAHTHTVEY
jgi:hypothetical protein